MQMAEIGARLAGSAVRVDEKSKRDRDVKEVYKRDKASRKKVNY